MSRERLEGAIEALEELEQLRNIRTFPLDCIMYLRCKYRAQLAALDPEPAQPWTPRERRLRKAAKAVEVLVTDGYYVPHEVLGELRDALAEAPPPDPRDEALEMAAQWLEAAANRCESILETSPEYHLADDIQNYRKAAAIARARGGTGNVD